MKLVFIRPFLGCSSAHGRQVSSRRSYMIISSWENDELDVDNSLCFNDGELYSSWADEDEIYGSIDGMTHISWRRRPHEDGNHA